MLQNKVAVITGASSGLGRAIALRYAAEGASLILADINEEGGQHTLSLLPEASRAKAKFIKVDVTNEAEVEAAVALAVSSFGQLDIMVANAGIGAPGFIASLSKEDF